MVPTSPSSRCVLLAAALALASIAHAQCPATFETFNGGSWTGQPPAAMVQWDPDGVGPLPTMLVVGGQFTQAGTVSVNGLAQWDGARWWAQAPGSQGIKALAVYNGELIAAGTFTNINGVPLNRIARWDGIAWRALGDGLSGGSAPACYALTTYNGELIAGGLFSTAGGVPCRSIARWNGSTWQPVGPALPQLSSVYALAQVGTRLLAGGNQLTDGTQSNSEILAWDGVGWSTFPPGSGWGSANDGDRRIQSITAMADGSLVVGRYAAMFPDVPLYRFSGAAWSQLGAFPCASTQGRPSVASITSFGGDLYASGSFRGNSADGDTSNVARWGSDSQWHRVVSVPYRNPGPSAVASATTFAGRLILGATAVVDDVSVYGIAAWDGDHYNGLLEGFDGWVSGAAATADDLVFTGSFRNFATTPLNGVARYDGSVWTPLGSGLNAAGRTVVASGSTVYVGGEFTAADGVPANHIARWDGAWHPLGNGTNDVVYALAFYNGDLIAAGNFTSADGAPAPHVARWDGAAWRPMGNGLNGPGL